MKKETTVFVRVPIMAFGILLLICNCALAQKELVIEYTAESERMRCTIEEYVQNGDEIKYSVQDEPADIQIMTYKQMQKAAENGDILPIEIDDVSSTVKFGDDVYGCAIKNYRTDFKAQHLELWKKMGLSVPEKELSWDIKCQVIMTNMEPICMCWKTQAGFRIHRCFYRKTEANCGVEFLSL